MESGQLTIFDAFENYFYVVPDYQREYIWKSKQIKQLLEDINKQMEGSPSESEHFIGTILVCPQDENKKILM